MATANTSFHEYFSSQRLPSFTKKFHGRLKVDAQFCPTDVEDLFSTVDWEVRSSQIKGENGELIFEQTNCEVPSFWSQLATNVICSKYFYGEVGTPEREYSVRQLVHRVARTIADWGLEDGYFATPARWRALLPRARLALPASARRVQLARLVQRRPVSPIRRQRREVQLALGCPSPRRRPTRKPVRVPARQRVLHPARRRQHGRHHGARPQRGHALQVRLRHRHRSQHAPLASRKARRRRHALSGPLSFMRVYDQIAAVVKSGGKTRRAAKMQSLKVWHPDVMEFIECKWKEEKKARVLIEKGGYDANFNGEAYSSIMFQNANLSVRVTDDFMQAVEKNEDWTTHWVTNPKQPGPTYPAREIMDRMAECAWHCGDPGVQYDTTINRWHTCPNSGRINASNPCSEYMFLDDTACNLASINLMKFRKADGTFDADRLPGRLPHLLHRPGNPGRSRQLPDARHRPQQPPVPAARPRLLEPRQPAHDGRHAVRFARSVRRLRCGHRRCSTVRPTSRAASSPKPSARSTRTKRTASRCSASCRCIATPSKRSTPTARST